MSKVLNVECPTCKKNVVWNAQSEYRPFCSERCKLIDLGEWASGSYTIPVEFNEENLNTLSASISANPSAPGSKTLQ